MVSSIRKKTVAALFCAVCIMVVFSGFSVQAFSNVTTSKAQETSESTPTNEALFAIPSLLLILPIAAAAAYVLEWRTSNTKTPTTKKECVFLSTQEEFGI